LINTLIIFDLGLRDRKKLQVSNQACDWSLFKLTSTIEVQEPN